MTLVTRRRLGALVATMFVATAVASPTASMAHPGVPLNVFDPVETGWLSIRDRTAANFDTEVTGHAQTHIPIDIEADGTPNGARYGAVFQDNVDHRGWLVNKRMTPAQY